MKNLEKLTNIIESILFVSGTQVAISDIAEKLLLTDKEVLAIRWHMGGHHASLTEKIEVIKAREDKLWKVIHHADKLDASGRYKGDIFYIEILR